MSILAAWSPTAFKFRAGLAVILGFFVCGFMSCRELSYMACGKTTQANVTDRGLVKVPVSRGRSKDAFRLDYKFQEPNGTAREGYVLFDPNGAEVLHYVQEVEVEYLSGATNPSRIAGQRQWGWPIAFFGTIAALIIWAIIFVRAETGGKGAPDWRKGRR